ncbi:MAG: protein kinase [Polyangiaceae bacterium]
MSDDLSTHRTPHRTRTATRDEDSSVSEADPARAEGHLAHAETELGSEADAPLGDGRDRIGETIGRFRLVSRLGEGGMGVVYAAEDLRLGRTVALKILAREAVHREDRRLRLLREARAASAVMHPSIAAIFEVGEHEGEVFLAMERVQGETLRAALRRREGPLPVPEALGIARAIAEGLREAHAADIVHRDLKPENVMLTPDGHVKILDFGLAKRVEAKRVEAKRVDAKGADPKRARDAGSAPPLASPTADLATREGQIMGTPGYMSPEQAMGEPVDPRTDLFSLGVLLYELLTQTRPFDGPTRLAVMMATYRDPAPPPSARNPAIPPAVDALVLRCLEKHPEDRFQSAAELIAALNSASSADSAGAAADSRLPVSTGGEVDSKTGRGLADGTGAGGAGASGAGASGTGANGAGASSTRSDGTRATRPLDGRRRQGIGISTFVLGAATVAAIAGVAVLGQRFAATPGATGATATSSTAAPPGASATTGTLAKQRGPSGGLASPALPGDSAPSGNSAPPGDSAPPGAPASMPRRPCLKGDPGMSSSCEIRDTVRWCDASGRAIGCCGKGLVPQGTDGICICPPGGTDVPSARARGCAAVSAAQVEARRAAHRSAIERSIACFRPETKPKSISGGTFEASYFLTPEGDVFDARVHLSTMPDASGQACAVAAIRAIRFPPPPGEDAGQLIRFGFEFQK